MRAHRPFMKWAICNETFADWPHERAFAFAAECGYRGLEIAPFTLGRTVDEIDGATRSRIRRLAEKCGLQIVGLHWLLSNTTGLHLTSPDAVVRRRTADYIGQLAQLCGDLGGSILVLGSPQQRNLPAGISNEQGMAYAADVIQQTIPAIERTNTILAVEPLSPTEGNFLCTAAEGAELVRRVGSPRCRLHLDCKAMASEPTPIPDLIRRHRSELVHFHANDSNLQGPGFGRLDFKPILATLREIDYQGWVSVEVFDLSPGSERTARESIDYLRGCLMDSGR